MDEKFDVIVVGAGPGGLSAATAAMRYAAQARLPGFRVAVLEREEIPGGILNQCVHDGFGIVRYGQQLSGPEYARIEWEKARAAGVEILTGMMVREIKASDQVAARTSEIKASDRIDEAGESSFRVTVISRQGRKTLQAEAIVIATGCRERTRGMLSIPGTRPAGIYTAGVAQNLINRKNIMIGRKVVILGSGDIGLIMARRLTLEGARVICVAEVMEEPSGLARNVRQCLFDFDIPLYLRTTVSDIFGRNRLEGVELSDVDEHLEPIPGTRRRIECDTLVLSVGLIPENEVAQTAGVALDPRTGGAATDEYLQTSVPGIFVCGNARAVMDLADFVSEQGEMAGTNAAAAVSGLPLHKWEKDLHNVARKGLPEEGSVTCTLCPKGCQVKLVPVENRAENRGKNETENGYEATGNGCPRGAAFAIQELTDPHRILTTTMRCAEPEEEPCEATEERALCEPECGVHFPGHIPPQLIPVRTDRPVPLGEMQELARQLRKVSVTAAPGQIRSGEVLVKDLGTEHVNIVAE